MDESLLPGKLPLANKSTLVSMHTLKKLLQTYLYSAELTGAVKTIPKETVICKVTGTIVGNVQTGRAVWLNMFMLGKPLFLAGEYESLGPKIDVLLGSNK